MVSHGGVGWDDSTYWDSQASTFDSEPDHGLADPDTRAAWLALLRRLLPDVPARVADIGTGTGTLAVLLGEQGYEVEGVDVAPAMVNRAIAKARAAGVTVGFRVGDAQQPGLEPRAFDVVLVRHVLWALRDPAGAVRAWIDLLAEGGRLVLIEGLWSTGGGLSAREVEDLIHPFTPEVSTEHLSDASLWGRPIDDKRFVIVAKPV